MGISNSRSSEIRGGNAGTICAVPEGNVRTGYCNGVLPALAGDALRGSTAAAAAAAAAATAGTRRNAYRTGVVKRVRSWALWVTSCACSVLQLLAGVLPPVNPHTLFSLSIFSDRASSSSVLSISRRCLIVKKLASIREELYTSLVIL